MSHAVAVNMTSHELLDLSNSPYYSSVGIRCGFDHNVLPGQKRMFINSGVVLHTPTQSIALVTQKSSKHDGKLIVHAETYWCKGPLCLSFQVDNPTNEVIHLDRNDMVIELTLVPISLYSLTNDLLAMKLQKYVQIHGLNVPDNKLGLPFETNPANVVQNIEPRSFATYHTGYYLPVLNNPTHTYLVAANNFCMSLGLEITPKIINFEQEIVIDIKNNRTSPFVDLDILKLLRITQIPFMPAGGWECVKRNDFFYIDLRGVYEGTFNLQQYVVKKAFRTEYQAARDVPTNRSKFRNETDFVYDCNTGSPTEIMEYCNRQKLNMVDRIDAYGCYEKTPPSLKRDFFPQLLDD